MGLQQRHFYPVWLLLRIVTATVAASCGARTQETCRPAESAGFDRWTFEDLATGSGPSISSGAGKGLAVAFSSETDTSGTCWIASSDGETWRTDALADECTEPLITSGTHGRYVAARVRNRSDGLFYIDDGAGRFVAGEPPPCRPVAITVRSTDRPVVLCRSREVSLSVAEWTGSTWNMRVVEGAGGVLGGAAILVTGSGDTHVAYVDDSWQLHWRRLSDGAEHSAPVAPGAGAPSLAFFGPHSREPQLVVASEHRIVAFNFDRMQEVAVDDASIRSFGDVCANTPTVDEGIVAYISDIDRRPGVFVGWKLGKRWRTGFLASARADSSVGVTAGVVPGVAAVFVDESGVVRVAIGRGLADGVDQNCDGVDGSDDDRDGYGSGATGGLDCNDEDPGVRPGADDPPADGRDTNCDGQD